MDLIKMTRELGAALQQDERYIAFQAACKTNEDDKELNEHMSKLQLIHMSYQHEANKDDADEAKLEQYNNEFTELYKIVSANPNMQAYEDAREDIDELMKYITGILSCCAFGEDPMTCEPQTDEHECGGECGECGGCH